MSGSAGFFTKIFFFLPRPKGSAKVGGAGDGKHKQKYGHPKSSWNLQLTKLTNYIRQRSWANVMYSSPFVCLFVCLSVSRITQKVMDGFERNIMGR